MGNTSIEDKEAILVSGFDEIRYRYGYHAGWQTVILVFSFLLGEV
jgi:hypothetical protein